MLISHSLGCYLFLNAWQTSGRLSLMFEILIYLKKSRINWTDIMSSLSLSLSLSRWYSCIGKNLKYIELIRIRKLWVDIYFLENVFHAKLNTRNTFLVFSIFQNTIKQMKMFLFLVKCFQLKIFYNWKLFYMFPNTPLNNTFF